MLRAILLSSILLCGCDFKINNGPKPKPEIVDKTTAAQAFDNYKKQTAINFKSLADRCDKNEFKYVAELIDASVKLDREAKLARSKPIDAKFKVLGSDEIDNVAAARILREVAQELEQ